MGSRQFPPAFSVLSHIRLSLIDKCFSVIHQYSALLEAIFTNAFRTFANWRKSCGHSPVHPLDTRQLAKVHMTFANTPPGHSPIGESPHDFRQYTPRTFANNWRKSYWRSSDSPVRTSKSNTLALPSFKLIKRVY